MRAFTIINGYTGALCLQELVDQGHEIVGVVTAPNIRTDVPPEETVIGIATKHLLPLYMPPVKVTEEPAEEFLNLVRRTKPDLLVSMHYPAIFKPAILDIPPLGCVNIHPSRVPEGRGMTPSFWYLYLGRDTAWTALHYLDEGVDSGDVIAFASIPITHDDTGATVSRRLSEAAWKIFRDNLPAIAAGRAPRQNQDLSQGSYLWAGRDWRLIRWKRKAVGVRGQIRCFTDSGNPAYTMIGGVKIDINDAEIAHSNEHILNKENAVSGEVLAINGRGPIIQTGEGRVVLTDFAVEGERAEALMALTGSGVPVILG
ncbi:methionyl-tRNA formyltransferase [Candidatus Poribacteria bacterium]